jgi:uncharacterized protein (DUF1697 family)
MTTHIALLRGVNLAGKKMVAMSDLQALLTRLGLADVQSALQSGNLVFRCAGRTCAQLERLLEAETVKRLKLEADFFVRTAGEWKAVAAANPFPQAAERDPGRLLVFFLKSGPDAQNVAALQAAIPGRELARVTGRAAYVVYPDGQGRSRFTSTLIEKKLATRATGRNWNTVMRLLALAGG